MKSSLTIAISIALTGAPFFTNAAPKIYQATGTVRDGSEITIEGSGFGEKSHPKPYFWWDADNGRQPSSLGRKHSWDKSFNGYRTNEIIAPNSQYSYKFDHGKSSGAALGAVKFNSDEVYLWRKTYEDFDVENSLAIRSRVKDVIGNFHVGQTVEGLSSGATGTIEAIKPDNQGRIAIFFKEDAGSIAWNNPVDFIYGEKMISRTATGINTEGNHNFPYGTLRTFNFKTLRFWNDQEKNNAYPVIQGRNGNSYNINLEHTNETIWNSSMRNSTSQKSKQWKIEELIYKVSDIGIPDGVFNYRINQHISYNKNVVTRTKSRNAPYNIIYQSQVSNGAQNDTNMYYDSVYIDDSWSRVMLCDSATWAQCDSAEIQIPKTWSNNKIQLTVNLGSLKNKDDYLYLYVFDNSNEVNEAGYKICPSCPNPPTLNFQ